nr:MAG TPA: Protein of unknown function (DUF3347) [Caudoviricetes sp.]
MLLPGSGVRNPYHGEIIAPCSRKTEAMNG